MRSIYYSIFTAILWVSTMSASAQQSKQVIIANGGVFGAGNQVTIASWNPSTNNYFVFDSIPASSVQDVILDGTTAYVAADSFIRSYNIANYTQIASTEEEGARKLAIWDDFLVVSRGFPTIDYYVQLRNKTTLVGTAADRIIVPTACAGIAIATDTAYLAMPGPFGSVTGSIAVVALVSRDLVDTINLDTLGQGLSRVYYNPDDDMIYTINNLNFGSTNGAFTQLDRLGNTVTTTEVSFPVGGGAGIYNNRLYGTFDGNFNYVDLPGYALNSTPLAPISPAGAAVDTSRNQFYLTTTDFFSFGSFNVYNTSGMQLDSFAIGISPEALAVDYSVATSSESPFNDQIYITAYPNPVTEVLKVDVSRLKMAPDVIELINLEGRTLAQAPVGQNAIDVQHLPAGTYFVRARTHRGDYIQPIIKQ